MLLCTVLKELLKSRNLTSLFQSCERSSHFRPNLPDAAQKCALLLPILLNNGFKFLTGNATINDTLQYGSDVRGISDKRAIGGFTIEGEVSDVIL